MKHIMQEHNECQLATIAMLSGKPKRQIRAYVEDCAGTTYEKLFSTGHWQACIKMAFRKYLNEQMFTEIFHMWGVNNLGSDKVNDTPNLDGEGQITILWDQGESHAMAFSNGFVHDPNAVSKCDWYTWRNTICKTSYPGKTIRLFSIVRYHKFGSSYS